MIKNDQDVIPNINLLTKFLNDVKINSCSYGILKIHEKVCRNKHVKCYIPFSSYNRSILPTYINGYLSIYNYKLLKDIDKTSLNYYPIIYKEDVHIGLLVEKTNHHYCNLKYKIIINTKYNFS